MRKIAITGSKGVVGCVLLNHLDEYQITALDLPECDVRDLDALYESLSGHEATIHLAWDARENSDSGNIIADNARMFSNVLLAASKTRVKRVILASSVHAGSFMRPYLANEDRSIRSVMADIPDSPYGATKQYMEQLGRFYSEYHGLEIVCLRLGGVRPTDPEPTQIINPFVRITLLRHADLISLVRRCLDATEIPERFIIINAVSDTPTRMHDVTNPLGWQPAAARKTAYFSLRHSGRMGALRSRVNRSWTIKKMLGSYLPGLFLDHRGPEAKSKNLSAGHRLTFSRNSTGADFLFEGWWSAEDSFTWTYRRQARIAFSLADPTGGDLEISLSLHGYCPLVDRPYRVDVWINQRPVERWVFYRDDNAPETKILVAPGLLLRHGDVSIILQMLDHCAPFSTERAQDERMLGVCLHALCIERASRGRGVQE